MGDRFVVRELQESIAIEVRKSPIFRDHVCSRSGNTFECALCELKRHIKTHPLAVLSILRHHGFFGEGWLPEESDLMDLMGHERLERVIAEQQRRLIGSLEMKCSNCHHTMHMFNTLNHYLQRYGTTTPPGSENPGTSFSFKCNKCNTDQVGVFTVNKKKRGKRKERIKKKSIKKPFKYGYEAFTQTVVPERITTTNTTLQPLTNDINTDF